MGFNRGDIELLPTVRDSQMRRHSYKIKGYFNNAGFFSHIIYRGPNPKLHLFMLA